MLEPSETVFSAATGLISTMRDVAQVVLASTQQQWKDTLSVNARLLAEQQQQLELQRPSRATRVRISTRHPLLPCSTARKPPLGSVCHCAQYAQPVAQQRGMLHKNVQCFTTAPVRWHTLATRTRLVFRLASCLEQGPWLALQVCLGH